MTGRPPKPIEVKRRTGNPGKRPLPSTSLTIVPAASTNVEPPAGLGAAGLAAWNDALAYADRWIGQSDLGSLRHLALDEDLAANLRADIAMTGHVLYTDKGYAYQNPTLGALATVEDRIRKWHSLFYLTPSDRSRGGVAEVKARSALEEMLARRNG